MNVRTIFRSLGAVVATILLSALGSGVWERFLSPAFSSLANFLTSTASTMSEAYSEKIYTRAAQISDFDQSGIWSITQTLFFLAVLGGVMHYIDMHVRDASAESPHKFRKALYSVIFIASFLNMYLNLIEIRASRDISLYATTNMEILRPYIGENEYFRLRSDFLRVKREEDFREFLAELYRHSEVSEVAIDDYEISPEDT